MDNRTDFSNKINVDDRITIKELRVKLGELLGVGPMDFKIKNMSVTSLHFVSSLFLSQQVKFGNVPEKGGVILDYNLSVFGYSPVVRGMEISRNRFV